MNCGEKIGTAAPEADSAPAEITPAEEAPIPASGKKPKKKKAVLLVSVLALLLVAVALANSSLFQSNIAAKAEKRIVGSWNGVFLENGDDTIRAKNLGGFTCTVEKGGAATISFSERSISDLSFYLTYSPEKTKAVNDGEKLADYCYDVKASDDPDASALDMLLSVTILSLSPFFPTLSCHLRSLQVISHKPLIKRATEYLSVALCVFRFSHPINLPL